MAAGFLSQPRTGEEAQAYLNREVRKLFGNGEWCNGRVFSIDTEIEDEWGNVEEGIFFAVRWVLVRAYRTGCCTS